MGRQRRLDQRAGAWKPDHRGPEPDRVPGQTETLAQDASRGGAIATVKRPVRGLGQFAAELGHDGAQYPEPDRLAVDQRAVHVEAGRRHRRGGRGASAQARRAPPAQLPRELRQVGGRGPVPCLLQVEQGFVPLERACERVAQPLLVQASGVGVAHADGVTLAVGPGGLGTVHASACSTGGSDDGGRNVNRAPAPGAAKPLPRHRSVARRGPTVWSAVMPSHARDT